MPTLAPDLLDLICCPVTHQPLAVAPPELIQTLNARIKKGAAKTSAGQPVAKPITDALVREDGSLAYPISNGIPLLLPEEGIPLT